MICTCSIVPPKVLRRFARDKRLSTRERKAFADAIEYEKQWRKLRAVHTELSAASSRLERGAAPPAPKVTVFNCKHGTTLPGVPVAAPGNDATSKRAFAETTAVAAFYELLFDRNSVDDEGKTLMSSVHFSVDYNNAFWNGTQMVYGDGDGNIFLDFTKASDVIGHELTHGVTQFSAQLEYSDEPGGLNESVSDVFGSMFRQWRRDETVDKADWLIGKEIIGPGAKARGFECLRDMSNPAAKHCLAPQPTHFSDFRPGMDPHESSGIPNLAFHDAAVAIGGYSWQKAGMIWYKALTAFGPQPNMKMKAFAQRTRKVAKSLFPRDARTFAAVDRAWAAVGL
ncbi:MAG TPA: M4 family metallopeptidase [Gammaproteobacteria bacterium]|nr:M4 family metallopeptidase [Gammaproteobacteria bacterium]